jgi:hypothetical protein
MALAALRDHMQAFRGEIATYVVHSISGGSFQPKLEISKSCGLAKSRLEASVTTHKINRFNS